MRACYVDLSTLKKDALVKTLTNKDKLPELEVDQFLTLLGNTNQETKLYKVGKEGVEGEKGVEEELQDILYFGDRNIKIEDMFSDPWFSSWLILKNLLWGNESEFVPGLCITLPSWEQMLETVYTEREEQFVLDEYGNKVVIMETITYADGSTKTVPKTNPDGSYVYETKFVDVVKGWITIYHGFGDRDLVYDVQDKKYYGQSDSGTLKNLDSRTILTIFNDNYCALI